MDFQKMLNEAGEVTKEVGNQIMVAAEKEDIGLLRPLSKQLREIMDILNVITLVDRMAGAAPDN